MGFGGQDRKPSAILPEKNACALYRKLAKPLPRPFSYGKYCNFLPLTVIILQTFTPAESIGEKKKISEPVNKKTGLH